MSKTKTILIIIGVLIILSVIGFFVGEFYLTGFDGNYRAIEPEESMTFSCSTVDDCKNSLINAGMPEEQWTEIKSIVRCNEVCEALEQ